jgi:hypothetical protein
MLASFFIVVAAILSPEKCTGGWVCSHPVNVAINANVTGGGGLSCVCSKRISSKHTHWIVLLNKGIVTNTRLSLSNC